MSISDLIKNKFVEEFTAISVGTLLTTLLLSFALGLFVLVIYRVTYGGVSFSKSFALSLVMLSMVTALFLALNLLAGKLHTNSYLVVMRYTPEGESAVRSKLGTLGKYKLKSRTMNLAETELVVEAKLSQKQMDSLEALLDNEGVSDVNIVSYNGSTLL